MSKTSLKQYQINKDKQIKLICFTNRYWWQQTNLCLNQGWAEKPTYKYNLHKVKQRISNDIEVNPGPILESTNKKHLHVCTYNVQGMKDFKKLKRFFNFLHKQKFISNAVINLQETHIECKTSLKYHWKGDIVQSAGTSNARGVAILYNKNSFDDVISTRETKDGRLCSFTAVKNGIVSCYMNIYVPNNHYDAYRFFQSLEDIMMEELETNTVNNFIISGDFNFVFNPDIDSIGRQTNNQERKVAELVKDIMTKFKIKDSYRLLHHWGGYTWGKNNPTYLRSRLDHILISETLCKSVMQSYTTTMPNESDHYFLYTEIDTNEIEYGPGVKRCNANLLEDETILLTVTKKIQNQMEQIPSGWNPHQRLDYVKMITRNIILEEGKKKAIQQKNELQQINGEITALHKEMDRLLTICNSTNKTNIDCTTLLKKIDSIKEAIEITNLEAENIKNEESKRLIFRSRVKWAEEGEKSNKYFLNIIKERQIKMQIRKIISNGVTHRGQNEIEKAISKFYKDLYKKRTDIKEIDEKEDMFKDLPELNEQDKNMLKKPLNQAELLNALKTCNESAPGPDGITYGVYKHLWPIFGPLLLLAWNFGLEVGSVSPSQKDSIITLLEKKGKDMSKIENLRPISLSNCDIKICTKAIAIRTNSVLDKILHKTQTGYVPGRQVNDNLRLIEELIEQAKQKKEETYLLTLDATKAFDSVDHGYLMEILDKYGFPQEYITWIKVIYTDLRANVLVNGYKGSLISIERSVKQGDALSCALFVISMDPLLRAIDKDQRIKPVNIFNDCGEKTDTVKLASYADDITALCSNKEGIEIIISLYTKFSSYSGIELNVAKTEILVMGKLNQNQRQFKIKSQNNEYILQDQKEVKICGLVFSNDFEAAYNQNVKDKINKMEGQLNVWRQRNLTLQGKILITKTFGLSQMIYAMRSTYVKPVDIKLMDNIIYKFIWNIKPSSKKNSGKLRRQIMQSERQFGGLNAPDVETLDKALKFKHIIRALTKYYQELIFG